MWTPDGPHRNLLRPRSSKAPLIILACAIVAFLLVAVPLMISTIRTIPGAANTNQPSAAAGAATAEPSPTAAASTALAPPTPEPTPPPPTTDTEPAPPTPDRTLKKNSIYSIDLGGTRARCSIRVRSPKPPLANSALAPYLRSLLKCMVKAFEKPLASEGFDLTTPKVKVYRKTIKSPCGRLGQRAAPAYYCSTDRTDLLAGNP